MPRFASYRGVSAGREFCEEFLFFTVSQLHSFTAQFWAHSKMQVTEGAKDTLLKRAQNGAFWRVLPPYFVFHGALWQNPPSGPLAVQKTDPSPR
jgi:hypothetical protein